jgi:DNA-binding transcriptional MerR regulator
MPEPETALTIGALAKKTDTKIETIRYYERIDLLSAPRRTSGNYRIYGLELGTIELHQAGARFGIFH